VEPDFGSLTIIGLAIAGGYTAFAFKEPRLFAEAWSIPVIILGGLILVGVVYDAGVLAALFSMRGLAPAAPLALAAVEGVLLPPKLLTMSSALWTWFVLVAILFKAKAEMDKKEAGEEGKASDDKRAGDKDANPS
jgi:hypothetical protein